jgi:RP/EB family microtubule-associated protein
VRAGAVALQLLDRLYPGEVPMRKVRWDAKTEDQMVGNYKLVQSVLSKKGVSRDVPVERLMRAKYQDNLEMMQWFKHFYESNKGPEPEPYDPVSRRALGRGADMMPIFARGGGVRADSIVGTVRRGAGGPAPAAAPPAAAVPAAGGGSTGKGLPGSAGSSAPATVSRTVNRGSLGATRAGLSSKTDAAAAASSASAVAAAAGGGGGGGAASGGARPPVAATTDAVRRELAEARVLADGLERERDFYFAKLRDIEILAQQYKGPDKPFVDQIFKILYATVDEFVDPEEASAARAADDDQEHHHHLVDDASDLPAVLGEKENDSL